MEHSLALRGMSALGLCLMIGLAWALSENRRCVRWRLVAWGVGLQFALGLLVMRTHAGRVFFEWVKAAFDLLTESSGRGAEFVFGNLSRVFILEQALTPGADGAMVPEAPFVVSAVVAFKVLPVIIFVAALAAMLQHLGVIQALVRGMAWLMRRTMKTSGAETFGTALLVFGGIESLSALRGYLKEMTRSELFTLMTAFLATIAASVMVAYATFGASPGHLLAASLMSAPAAIAVAKVLVPETETPPTSGEARVEIPLHSHNVFDAAAQGAGVGLNMALHVGAMLIVFVGLIYLFDQASVALTSRTIAELAGWIMRPFAWIMGVPWRDVPEVARLLAVKSVFNEFIAYSELQPVIAEQAVSRRGITIATYALCGFANPGSLGIMIGGISALAPERRSEVAALSVKAFIGGTLAAFMTACVAGVLISE